MCRLLCSLLFVNIASFCVRAEASGRATITNTTELIALSDAATAQSRSFELTGTVLFVDKIGQNFYAFVLDDGHTGAFLHGRTSQVKVGDVMHVKGYTLLSDSGEHNFAISTLEKKGAHALPAPVDAPLDFAAVRSFDYKRICVKARIHDIFVDELDAAYVCCILTDGSDFAYATCQSKDLSKQKMVNLIGADVKITGMCLPALVGHRFYMGGSLRFDGVNAIQLLKPAIQNPYELPKLESLRFVSPQHVKDMGLRRARGKVLAQWNGNSLMLETPDRQLHIVTLKKGQSLPSCGDTVTVSGKATTDFYLINLTHAICIIEETTASELPSGAPIQPSDVLKRDGRNQIDSEYYGRIVKIRGTVSSPNSVINDSRYLYLDCQTHVIPVNISSLKNFTPPSRNSIVEATGVCLMDVENWHADNPLPTIKGFFIVARTSNDITIVARPPFWTPLRALSVMGAALVLLLGFVIWNVMLNRLVKKRSMELRSSQINEERAEIKTEERTRLAVELHDSLSQNLAGIACQLSATSDALTRRPDILPEYLATAQRMLASSRTELKRCLFDLRGDALETDDFESAIRKTLSPYLDQADISTKFHIHRAKLDESLAHTALCIIRELVANAIRHGKAKAVRIAGSLDGNRLLFSVCDDGTGFDADNCPGPAEGHFGIDGIGERVERYNGTLAFDSAPGNGTKVRVMLTVPPVQDEITPV